MIPVQARVEVRFDGTNWVDVSAYLTGEVSIKRGRDGEQDDPISVGTCTLSLVNDDGRFSPDLLTSPYWPNVREGVLLRVSVWADSAWRVRFYGPVQSWAVSWLDESAGQALSTVTASDTLGNLPSFTFRQAADEVVRNTAGVAAHYPLRGSNDPQGALIGAGSLTSNGAGGLGDGSVLLPLEEGTDQHPLFESASGGLKLTWTGGPIPRYFCLVFPSAPTASCTILEITTDDADTETLKWSSSSGFYNGSVGTGFATGVPSSWPVMLWVDCTISNIRVNDASGFVSAAVPGSTNNGQWVSVVFNPTLSGGAKWSVAHLILSDSTTTLSHTAAATLATKLLGPRVPASGTAISQLLTWAGGPTVTGATTGEATLPALEGRDAADAIGALVTGMGARLVDDLDGTLTWVPRTDPTAAIALPDQKIAPELAWQTSIAGWASEVTATFLDGTTYTASRTDGKRQSLSIEGVHADPANTRAYADWLVATGNRGASLPNAPFDLATLSETDKATLCSVTPGRLVTIAQLPTQMPAAITAMCEGLEERIGANTDPPVWSIDLKLSQGGTARLFILNDTVRGVLDSNHYLS